MDPDELRLLNETTARVGCTERAGLLTAALGRVRVARRAGRPSPRGHRRACSTRKVELERGRQRCKTYLAADVGDTRHHGHAQRRPAPAGPGRCGQTGGRGRHDRGRPARAADEAALLVAAVRGPRGERFAVAVEPADVRIERRQGLDPDLWVYAVSGTTGRRSVVAEGAPADTWWEAAQARGRLALCRHIVAALAVMIEQARSHVSERAQFGRLVGTFQAVRHKLVEAHVATTAADCMTSSAWESDDLALAAATAKVVTGKAVGVTAGTRPATPGRDRIHGGPPVPPLHEASGRAGTDPRHVAWSWPLRWAGD